MSSYTNSVPDFLIIQARNFIKEAALYTVGGICLTAITACALKALGCSLLTISALTVIPAAATLCVAGAAAIVAALSVAFVAGCVKGLLSRY